MKLPEKDYLILYVQTAAWIAGSITAPSHMSGHDNYCACFVEDVSKAACKLALQLFKDVGIEKGP